MRKNVRSTFNYFLIIIFYALGIIGLILPIIPGLLFLVLGTLILSFELPYVEQMLEKYISKDSTFGKKFFEYKIKLEKYFR